jgi:signal transduction histidine kinase
MLTGSLRRSVDERPDKLNRDWLVARLDSQARCLEQLEHVIDTVLCTYRVETGELEPVLRSEDLCEIVRDVIRAENDALADAQCECLLDAPEDVFGAWDRAQIEIAVANLVNNASKYGRGRPIEIGVSMTHDTAFVRIRDHGAGIAPEDLPRLFQRFRRLAPDGAPTGIGLGLWFARAIALAHGGELSVESEREAGACFTLELPRNSASP